MGPSHAAALLRCGYRVAWERVASGGGEPLNVKAVLGTIGHSLCEQAALGKLGVPDEEWDVRFDAAWHREAEAAHERQADLGAPESWAGFNLQKALWRSKARKAAGRARQGPSPTGGDTDGSGVEVSLRTADGILAGVADVIVRSEDFVEIRDLKSGRTLDASGEILEAYRIQLLLYAVMFEDMYGVWPSRLVIDPIVRDEVEVAPDRFAALRYKEAIGEAIDEFNRAAAGGSLSTLARPRSENCSTCSYVLDCEPFWRAANKTWSGRPLAVEGTILDESAGVIRLTATGGTVAYGEWLVGGVSPTGLGIGSRLRITGLSMRGEGRLALGSQARLAGI